MRLNFLIRYPSALARARLSSDRSQLEDVKVIFSQKPRVASNAHFGFRNPQGATLSLTAPCGHTNTARKVATKSTGPGPVATTAGR